jgi:DNA excision repair protein ERCC-1
MSNTTTTNNNNDNPTANTPNKKVVCNPYAKKRKAPPPPPPPPSPKQSFSYAPSSKTKTKNNNSSSMKNSNNNNNFGSSSNVGSSSSSGSDNVFGTDNISFVAGSFSQAFNSIDDTPNFRRASNSFQELKKKDSSSLSSLSSSKLVSLSAKMKIKNKNQKQNQISNNDNTSTASTTTASTTVNASSSSSRHGDGGGNRDGGGVLNNTASTSTRIAANNNNNNNNNNANANVNNNNNNNNNNADIRIHHTMLQPHVLYVSPKQRGNNVLSLIKNVPMAYSTMVPDYIMGPTTCGLFLSIKYHKLHPKYINKRISELNKDFKLRILLVLVDIDDNTNSIQQLNLIGVRQDFTVILCWSEIEVARYLETYKSKDGKTHDISCITKKESTNIVDRVTDFLISGHKGIGGVNKTDSITLWNTFGSVKAISTASNDELSLCIGMGPLKIKRLYNALHKPFSKFQSRKRKKMVAAAEEAEAAEAEKEKALLAQVETEDYNDDQEEEDDDDDKATIISKNEGNDKEVV